MSDIGDIAAQRRALRQLSRLASLQGVATAAGIAPAAGQRAGRTVPTVTGLAFTGTRGTFMVTWNSVNVVPKPRYRLQLSLNSSFNTIAFETTTFNPAFTWPEADPNTVYYGRVRAEIGGAVSLIGAYSAVTQLNSGVVIASGFAEKTSDQTITAPANDDITQLTGIDLPNTQAVSGRKFDVFFAVEVSDTSGSDNGMIIGLYSGANGNKSDTPVYRAVVETRSSGTATIAGFYRLSPASDSDTKVGLTAAALFGNYSVQGAGAASSTLRITEVT